MQYFNTIDIACRHSGRGHLYRHEDQLIKFAGEDWDSISKMPVQWNQLRVPVVQSAVKSWVGERYLRTYEQSERYLRTYEQRPTS